jgi:hypothetical protein
MKSVLLVFASITHATPRSRKNTKVPLSGFGGIANTKTGQSQMPPDSYISKENLVAGKALVPNISKRIS